LPVIAVTNDNPTCVHRAEEDWDQGDDHSREIDQLILEIQARLPELRSHCRHWSEAGALQHNAVLREIELDTLRKLRLFARMLNARLGAIPAHS
jgi:hypothetical protein